MSKIILNSRNSSVLREGEEIVLGGKNGFTSQLGVIPITVNSVSANNSSIVLTLNNLHLLEDDNLMVHVLELPGVFNTSESYVRVPINQYKASNALFGAVGFADTISNVNLEIQTFNVSANTITVANKPYNSSTIDIVLPATPFLLEVFQPIKCNSLSNLTVFVKGLYNRAKLSYDVTNFFGDYTAELPITPSSINDISVLLDDVLITNFSWSSNTVTVPLIGTTTKLETIVNYYTTPRIERKDFISLSFASNVFSITNTSYQVSDIFFDPVLTSNNFFKVKIDKRITCNVTATPIVNITSDLEGRASNITDTSFELLYDEQAYPYSYELANNKIYYAYQKNKVRFTTARLDEFGRLRNIPPGNYIVEATNINRYNRTSSTVKALAEVEPLRLSKVSTVDVEEFVFIDTTGGASITATISFPIIANRDITSYILRYRVLSSETSSIPEYTDVTLTVAEEVSVLRHSVSNLDRGRSPGSNILDIIVKPANGTALGFETRRQYALLGKQTNPFGLKNLSIAQQDNFIIYSWQFVTTSEGFIFDLDTKEVEIRNFPGVVDVSNSDSIRAVWGLSTIVDRIPFPNTTFTSPISSFGASTYLLRVRDTSDRESDDIAAYVIETVRPSGTVIFKAYNEREPGISFLQQNGENFPNSNTHPEISFPSFNDTVTNGLVSTGSSNTDNANGSALGFSVYSNTSFLTTSVNPRVEYITQIRDVGQVIRGVVRASPTLSTESSSISYTTFYQTIASGVTDFHGNEGLTPSGNVLVDAAFSGIGRVLGFDNSFAAVVSYNSFLRTLTSGGPLGNVYAIRNPGQFVGDSANANSYALIAGVINANAIAIGEVFLANGNPSQSNLFSNVAISGNSYELVNLVQFGDEGAKLTFLGPETSIVQNLFIRISEDNVFYSAASNGVVGFPGHGNTNPNAFIGASSNADLGWRSYIPGEYSFRYFQLKLELINPQPNITSILLEDLKYEVSLKEKTVKKEVEVNSVEGILVDYSFIKYVNTPSVSATMLNTNTPQTAIVSNVSNNNCFVKVFYTANSEPSANALVSLLAVGV
jgi:hypothetical protein